MHAVLWRLTACALMLAAASIAQAADMIGNCEMSGKKGDMAISAPVKAGLLTVAVSLPAPMWWNGEAPESIKDGFEFCLAANVAWHAGFDKMQVVNVDWAPLLSGQVKAFDLALSEVAISDDRRKTVDFSPPYFRTDLGVLTKKDAVVDAKSIKTMRVGVQQGTSAAAFAASTLKPKSVSTFAELGDLFAALRSGQIDAAVTDFMISAAEVGIESAALSIAGRYHTAEGFGAVYPKGSANAATLDQIFKSLEAEGTEAALARKYLWGVSGVVPESIAYFDP